MAEIIPREFIELVLAKIDVVDLINTQVPLRKKSNNNYFARCPFHNEKSASFSVSQVKQFYHCFGCGAHGNAIDFLMQHDRLNFPEAIAALARLVGMEVPRTSTHTKKDDSVNELYDLNNKAAAFYYDQMRRSPKAIDYLKKRGISGIYAQKFQLGYAPSGWSHLSDKFAKNDIEKKRLLDTGLTIKKTEGGYYDRFRDRIIFPIHDHRGRIIGFGGRILDQGEPKYLNSPETVLFQKGHELYGLYQALKAQRNIKRLLIVEGYMDVIALFQYGITYALATLGTATTSHHLQRLQRYTSEIIFCFDGDEAGRHAAWRALEVAFTLMHESLQIRFLFLPQGEDPDSLVRKEGKAAFEQRIENSIPLSQFFFQNLSQQADLETPEGRARFASLALSYIKQLPANLFQTILLTELAKRARINEEELRGKIGGAPHAKKRATLEETTQEKIQDKLPPALRLAITLLIQHPKLATLVPHKLPKSELTGFSFLYQLIELIQQKPDITTGSLMEYWRGREEEGFVKSLAQATHLVPEVGVQNEFNGALKQIQLIIFDNEINCLLAKAANDGLSSQEKQALTEWINKKKELAQALS